MKSKSIAVAVFFAFVLYLLTEGSAGATSYNLTVSAQGSGMVTPDNTNNPHPAGVVITITATPSNGWYFANWSGDTNGSVNPLGVTMNSDLVITGNFLAYPVYTLTLATNGQGAIDLNPPGGSYLSNTLVTATATPATGWVFAGWSGATNTSSNVVSIMMNTSSLLTGTFTQLPVFDVQPGSVTNQPGSTVSFTAHAMSNTPLGYNWFFSGSPLASATNTTLSLTNVTAGQAGNYWVVATNNYGSATSQVATLTLTNTTLATHRVNSLDEGSLLAALAQGGWIGFGLSGTVTITNTINITNHVILDGGVGGIILNGGNAVRLFNVTNGASLTATNLTLANGTCIVTNGPQGTPADAGAIYNKGGTVILTACTLTNNQAQSLVYGGLARGGAIFNNGGTVSLYQSIVTNNLVVGGGNNSAPPLFTSTTGTGLGGAIYNTNGAVAIIGCNVNGNVCTSVCEYYGTALSMGGAVFQSSGTLTIANSSIMWNQAAGGAGASEFGSFSSASPAYGGAVAVNGGSLAIAHSQFVLNVATGGAATYHGAAGPAFGGALYSAGTLTVGDSSFYGNQANAGNDDVVYSDGGTGVAALGGAIYSSGAATLNRCAVYSNYVQGGSAVPYEPSYSANGGNGLGGGIFNASQMTATNCTIALNVANGGTGEQVFGPVASGGSALGGGVLNDANAEFIAMNLTIASNTCSSPAGFGATSGLAAGDEIANTTNSTLSVHNTLVAYGPQQRLRPHHRRRL
jgi:hypothetical protein